MGPSGSSGAVDLDRSPFSDGLVQVYTGDGKGKTTAALGLALRACGHGLNVFFAQFLKGVPPGELAALAHLPGVAVKQFGKACWTDPAKLMAEDSNLAQAGLRESSRALHSGQYQLVVLDEINLAAAWGLVQVEQVLKLIHSKPRQVELVLTGRQVPLPILARADLVTEMNQVKHPFNLGTGSRRGIEF